MSDIAAIKGLLTTFRSENPVLADHLWRETGDPKAAARLVANLKRIAQVTGQPELAGRIDAQAVQALAFESSLSLSETVATNKDIKKNVLGVDNPKMELRSRFDLLKIGVAPEASLRNAFADLGLIDDRYKEIEGRYMSATNITDRQLALADWAALANERGVPIPAGFGIDRGVPTKDPVEGFSPVDRLRLVIQNRGLVDADYQAMYARWLYAEDHASLKAAINEMVAFARKHDVPLPPELKHRD